jgi:hypothetical protein
MTLITPAAGPATVVELTNGRGSDGGGGDGDDDDAQMTKWLLDPDAEWPMDIYTATYLLWNMTELSAASPAPLSFLERNYRRFALFAAFAFAFVLQIVVPCVLIYGTKAEPLKLTDYPLCTSRNAPFFSFFAAC